MLLSKHLKSLWRSPDLLQHLPTPFPPPCHWKNRSGRLAFCKAVGARDWELGTEVAMVQGSRLPPPVSPTPTLQPLHTPAGSLVAPVSDRWRGECCPRIPFFPNQDYLTPLNSTVEKSEGAQTSSFGTTCQPFFPPSCGILFQSNFPLPFSPFVPHSRFESQGG